MKRKLCNQFFLLLALLFVFNADSFADEMWKNTITASGSSTVEAQPDVAYITINVAEEGMLSVDAVKNTDEKVNKITSALKEEYKDIQMDIKVTTIKLSEKFDQTWGKEEKSPTPESTQQILVTLTNLDSATIHKIIDTALRAGGRFPTSQYSVGNVSAVQYGLLKYESAYNEALKQAIDKARQEAERAAQMLNKKVGEVVYVACGATNQLSGCNYQDPGMLPFPARFTSPSAEYVTVKASVTVNFKFE